MDNEALPRETEMPLVIFQVPLDWTSIKIIPKMMLFKPLPWKN